MVVRLTFAYYGGFDDTGSEECNLLAPSICRLINRDSYTMILMIWAALQLTWVTMLMFVQLLQIGRAMTTYENMHGSHDHGGRASQAITSALATGSTSMDAAQLGSGGRGPDPAASGEHSHHGHQHKGGCFAQWKKILGVDTFVSTALQGNKPKSRQDRNPFSRGCLRNCQDFWCDSAPIFGDRENGAAMLDGEVVNYTKMYEPPMRMTTRSRRAGDSAGAYESVAGDESV